MAKRKGKSVAKAPPRSGVALDPGVLIRLRVYRDKLERQLGERVSLSRAVGIAVSK